VPYQVTTRFVDWQSNSVDNTGNIIFESSCDAPATFQATTQDNVGPVVYKAEAEVWQLTPFTIVPSLCQDTIVYEIVEILDVDGFDTDALNFIPYTDY